MLWREDRFEADLFKNTAREKAQIWESGDVQCLHRSTSRSKGQEPAQKTLDEYQKLVQIYATRNFTHDKDVLLAFQGIEQTMKPSVGDFFWGLPKRGFNAALTWAFTGQPRHREDFPSWSWAGWKGPDKHSRVPVEHQRALRRTRGEPPLSLADEDVDVCIINKSWLGDEEDHIAGAFRSTSTIWGPPQQVSRPTWQAVAEKLGLDRPLLVDRLDQLLVFYAMAIEADPSRNYYDFGYWALNEHATGGMHSSESVDPLSRRDSPTTELRQRDWIVVQHFGGKYAETMLIEWVDNVAYRVELRTFVYTRSRLGHRGSSLFSAENLLDEDEAAGDSNTRYSRPTCTFDGAPTVTGWPLDSIEQPCSSRTS
ncbi:hypothetical protein EDB80DRAFT_829378 [Ilyonectria destructans]|nr:hypothetical protein EDB80DRAFT_829378 [Ilyonectria destructans]